MDPTNPVPGFTRVRCPPAKIKRVTHARQGITPPTPGARRTKRKRPRAGTSLSGASRTRTRGRATVLPDRLTAPVSRSLRRLEVANSQFKATTFVSDIPRPAPIPLPSQTFGATGKELVSLDASDAPWRRVPPVMSRSPLQLDERWAGVAFAPRQQKPRACSPRHTRNA